MEKGRLEAFSDGVIAITIMEALCVIVALIWLVPDRRIERSIARTRKPPRKSSKAAGPQD